MAVISESDNRVIGTWSDNRVIGAWSDNRVIGTWRVSFIRRSRYRRYSFRFYPLSATINSNINLMCHYHEEIFDSVALTMFHCPSIQPINPCPSILLAMFLSRRCNNGQSLDGSVELGP